MPAVPRLFVAAGALEKQSALQLVGAEHHYLSRVLRLEVGDKVMLLDGKGQTLATRIAQLRSDAVELETLSLETKAASPYAEPAVTLYMAHLKGERHDLVMQKATELGARRIVTLHCRRSVPAFLADRSNRRLERWMRIVRAAAQQCRRADLPEVSAPLDFAEGMQLAAARAAQRLLLYEGPAPGMRSVLAELCPPAAEIDLLIGPEGGFEADEIAAAIAAGFVPCSLGPRILRAETAALAALAVVLSA